MVRNYKRKSKQHEWTEENMIRAITAVRQQQMNINEAGKQFKVPVATLFRRCKKTGNVKSLAKKQLGRFRPIFTQEQELELKKHILDMEKRLFGLTIRDLRLLAYQFAEKNGIPHNFSRIAEMAGRDWVDGFLKRNQEMSIRVPENTSAARASAFNKTNVGNFFELLDNLMGRFRFPPSAIYNCDETGITTVPNKPSKIIARRGKKQVGSLSSAERGVTVTTLICCNAMGQYIPPLIIFPRVRKNPLLEIGLPPETKIVYHPSGWMQSEIFAPTWINHFVKYARPSLENPVLLILDGHSTHVRNLTLLEVARQNNIHILVLPPHTSHRLQPLDVSFMFPLSTFYEQHVKTWLRNNPGRVISVMEVGSLFGQAYMRAATAQNAISGFKNTGICPMNPEIFPDELFEPSETTNREIREGNINIIPEDNNPLPNIENESAELNTSETVTTNCTAVRTTPNHDKNISVSSGPSGVEFQPATTTSCAVVTSLAHGNNVPVSPTPGPSGIDITISTPEKLYFSPAELLPLPKVSLPKKVKRKTGKTVIITSSPYLNELRIQKESKNTPVRKQTIKQVKRRIDENNGTVKAASKMNRVEKDVSDDSDESSDSIDENQLCNDSSSDLSEFSNCSAENENNVQEKSLTLSLATPEENDYVLVELENEKKNSKKDFVGQILKIIRNNSDVDKNKNQIYTVKFMRNYRNHKNIFIFPEVDDISEIFVSEIKGKLLNYVQLRYGKIEFK